MSPLSREGLDELVRQVERSFQVRHFMHQVFSDEIINNNPCPFISSDQIEEMLSCLGLGLSAIGEADIKVFEWLKSSLSLDELSKFTNAYFRALNTNAWVEMSQLTADLETPDEIIHEVLEFFGIVDEALSR